MWYKPRIPAEHSLLGCDPVCTFRRLSRDEKTAQRSFQSLLQQFGPATAKMVCQPASGSTQKKVDRKLE